MGSSEAFDRAFPVPGASQQPAMGQQQPGGRHRALRAGRVLAALIDPQRLLGDASLLGQPSLQPGQGRLQVADLAAAGPQLVQDRGRLLRLAGADQALGQQRPPQDRVHPAAAVQGRVVPPVTQRVGHAEVVTRRLADQGPGHRRVQSFLAVVQAGRRLLGQPGVPLGLLGRAPPGRHAGRRQMQQRQLVAAGMYCRSREPLLGGEQHIVPGSGEVLGQRQIEVGAQAKGDRGALARHLDAGGQVAHGLAQVAGQQPENPPERQAVDIDLLDARRVSIQVPQLGQGVTRAGHLGGADRDQGTRLAGRRRVQTAGIQRPPPERHHLLPVPHKRVGAGQAVGDQGGQRLAVRVGPCLRQRLAEPQLRLAELT